MLYLLLTAAIWGFAFVAQSVGNAMGSFTFNCIRSFIGGTVLLPVIYLKRRLEHRTPEEQKKLGWTPELWKAGLICGICLCLGSSLQQVGLNYTSAGKAGFITAFYIVLVPIFGLFLKKKCPITAYVGVGISLVGLFLLCMPKGEGLSLSSMKGDLIVLCCAFAFTVQILVIDRCATQVDGVKLSCMQFYVTGIITAVPMLLFEHPTWAAITSEPVALLYAGILSCGVAYTLQIFGQKGMNPTIASLIMSMESVVSVLAGWVLLGQKLSVREIGGCVLMFAAIVLAQLPSGTGNKKEA